MARKKQALIDSRPETGERMTSGSSAGLFRIAQQTAQRQIHVL
jgi:hypothetical protein